MSPEMQKHFEHQIIQAEKHAEMMERRALDCAKEAEDYAQAGTTARKMAEQFRALLDKEGASTVTVKLELDTTQAMANLDSVAKHVAQIAEQFNAVSAGGNALLTQRV